MKLDARTIVAAVVLNLAAALIVAWLLRRSPELRRLVDNGSGCGCG